MAIYRGTGGAGDANNNATVTEVTQQATNAANSATAAASSATSAASSASSASTSATNAASSASSASTSASSASSSATTASTAATAAQTAQTAAETAETNAETAQTAAEAAQTAAETAKTGAETAQTAAETAKTGAETARDATLAAYDDFDDRYLGAKASEPTLDNDGNALLDGAIFFDTTNAQLKVYDLTSTSWVAGTLSASQLADVETVADNISDVNTVVTNIVDIQNASTNAATATTKAAEASASATAAATSATNAANSATNAATSATNASTSETNAASSASAASTSASNASTSATAAASSATAAASSASAASTSETNAATSASNAATSETNAATSATNASNSATAASTAQTAAETAQSAAETAQAAAEAAQEAIDGLYLGAQASNPTLDNNGSPVTAGDWYYNTTDNTTRIYDGSNWNTINPDLVGDLTPQLGGTLDANGNIIDMGVNTITDTKVGQWDTAYGWGDHSTAGYLTTIAANSVGITEIDVTDGTNGQVLTTDGAGNLSFTDAGGGITLAGTYDYITLAGDVLTRNQVDATTDISGLATVATSGAYGDLSGTPTLATVATTGAYSDLSGTPTLGTLASLNTVNAATITDNSVGAAELNVTGNGTTSQYLRSDGDGTFTWATPPDTNTTYSAGTGVTLTGTTFSIGQAVGTSNSPSFQDLTLLGTLNVRTAIDLADNDILRFGSGDDCEFFCNGSHMYIDLNAGIGNLYIRDATTTRFTFDDAGHFTATGNVTAYSDERLKDEIEVIGDALAKVNQLRGVTYVRTDEKELGRQTGVIAQEVEAVLPEAVITLDDEMQTKSVAYGNMVGLLIEAVKELSARVEELESK